MSFSLKSYSGFKKIADGGMSEIFRAIDRVSRRTVVVKKMAFDPADRDFSLQRYENEAKNASLLSHSGIISILDFGEYDGAFYIVMEHVDGFNLGQIISGDPFNHQIGLMIVLKALQALQFAHKNGVIHCDIKPANILIARNGRVILTDFGLSQAKAHAMDPEKGKRDFTTPLFMPPEQAKVVAEKVGLASDVWEETATVVYSDMSPEQARMLNERGVQWDLWSVGVLLFRICSGRYPFNGNDLAGLLTSIVHTEATRIHELVEDLPGPIAAVIERCLEKEPYRRPHSIDTVIDALRKHFVSLDVSNMSAMIAGHVQNYAIGDERYRRGSPQPVAPNAGAVIEKIVALPGRAGRKIKSLVTGLRPAERREGEVLENDPAVAAAMFKEKAGAFFGSRIAKPALALVVLGFLTLFGTMVYNNGNHEKTPEIVATAGAHDAEKRAVQASAAHQHQGASETAAAPVSDTVARAPVVASVPVPAVTKPSRREASVPAAAPATNAATLRPLAAKTRREKSPAPPKAAAPSTALAEGGLLRVSVDPAEARVYVDGEMIARKEMQSGRKITVGFHDILAQAPGYEPYQQSFLIEKNKTQILAIVLKSVEKGNGQLHVYSYPWSNLHLDGALIGTTPTPSPITLPEGEHLILLLREGFKPHQEQVRISRDEVTRIQVQLVKADEEE